MGLSAAALLALLFVAKPVLSSRCYANFDEKTYPSCAQLSPSVSLHWSVQDGSIAWAVDVDGAWDWVGVGISEGGMLGADMAVASHDSVAAQWTASDYWSTGFTFPQLDKQQDVQLVSVARHSAGAAATGAGSTLIAMRRPLQSCDPNGQDRPVIDDTRQTVVFAYGTGPFGYHGSVNRGQSDVTFLPNGTAAAAAAGAPMPALQTFEMRIPNFTVPSAPTTYQCVNIELPSDAKYHIYRYEPIIDNAPLVHHFVAYTCAGGGPPSTALGVPYGCLGVMECEEFYLGWAPGVGAVDAPAQAALAFGQSSVRYMALQIHYNNVEGLEGQVDSSGFRLLYSSTLKPYDMGVLTLGSYDIAVPPGAPSWSTEPNVCPGSCTSRLAAGSPGVPPGGGGATPAGGGGALPGGGLTLVESFYHMHQTGRSMVTRHVRGGVELPPLGSRDYYQFDYQAPVDIPPGTRQLLPGDVLITSCTYSGVGRTNVTEFGAASYKEMCFNFLSYYPYNPDVTNCIGISTLNMATCSTGFHLDLIRSADDVQRAATAGELVALPPNNWTYKPYQPACQPSASYQGSTGTDGDDSDDDDAASRHHRNVGGAVAAILIVTVVGGAAIFAVFRFMRRKRQAEEEQHLFEKYNPSSIALPVVDSGAAQTEEQASGSNSKGYTSLTSAAV